MRDFDDATYDYGLDPGESFEPEELRDEPFDLSQPHVMTPLGPIDPSALGFALAHMPVIRRPRGLESAGSDSFLDDPAALAELEGYFFTGGRAVVDLATEDAGRDIAGIAWVAARAPVHIVLATGAAYGGDDRPEGAIAESMIRELTVGIGETASKAGIIVAGSAEEPFTETDGRVLRAAAAAHRATGAPIVVVSNHGALASAQLDLLRAEGAEPDRVIAGCFAISGDDAAPRALLEQGGIALFDWRPAANGIADGHQAVLVKRLVDAGFGEQILISGELARRSARLADGGAPGLGYFLDRVPLLLMEAGLTAAQVRNVFIDNPARALPVVPPAS